jgi:hypothetical protein
MTSFSFKSILSGLLFFLFGSVSFGHPGHGHVEDGVIHHLLEPFHILPVILIITAMIVSYKLIKKYAFSKKKK